MGTAWNIKCFILKIKGKQTINANRIWLSLEVIATLIREMLLQKLENYRWLIIDWFSWLIALLSLLNNPPPPQPPSPFSTPWLRDLEVASSRLLPGHAYGP